MTWVGHEYYSDWKLVLGEHGGLSSTYAALDVLGNVSGLSSRNN